EELRQARARGGGSEPRPPLVRRGQGGLILPPVFGIVVTFILPATLLLLLINISLLLILTLITRNHPLRLRHIGIQIPLLLLGELLPFRRRRSSSPLRLLRGRQRRHVRLPPRH